MFSPLMELFEQQNINTFEEAHTLLTNEPYSLKINVNEDKSLFCVFFDDKNKNKDSEIVKECNGIIIEYNNIRNVICNGMMHYENKNIDDISKDFIENFHEYVPRVINDGTNIRLFHYNGKWHIATRTIIDAFKSFWNNKKSFGQMFLDCINTHKIDYKTLSKDYTYEFLLQHNENRIVVDYKMNTIIHTNTIHQKLRVPVTYIILGIPGNTFKKFESFDEMKNDLLNSIVVGYSLVGPTNNFQLFSKKYIEMKQLKGNNQNTKRHLVNIIKDNKLNDYLTYFPEFTNEYRKVNAEIRDFVNKMYVTYVDMKIKKKQVQISQFEKEIMYLTHGEFIRNKTKVSRKLINKVLMSLDSYKIYRLLK
jgi:hypothetical protein